MSYVRTERVWAVVTANRIDLPTIRGTKREAIEAYNEWMDDPNAFRDAARTGYGVCIRVDVEVPQ